MTDIELKRSSISARMVQSLNIDVDDCDSVYENCDLDRLFFLYDEIFFNDGLLEELGRKKPTVEFVDKNSRTAGSANFINNSIEINIRAFRNYYAVDRVKTVDGIETKDVFEAIMLVFEHEIGHFICYKKYRDEGHGQYFKLFMKKTFEHTDCRHTLPQKGEVGLKAQHDVEVVIPDVNTFKKGDRVRFPYRNGYMEGEIVNIRKRAVIETKNLVTDMPMKYYVPLIYLVKIIK